MEPTTSARSNGAWARETAAWAEAGERIAALGRSLGGVRGRLVPVGAGRRAGTDGCPGRAGCGVALEHCARQWSAWPVTEASRHECAGGLCVLMVPVLHGGAMVGRGELGPFRVGAAGTHGRAADRGRWDDSPVPLLPEPAVAGAVAVLAEIGRRGTGGTDGRTPNADPPAVRWARRQIDDNLGERLNVGRLAATVRLSADHFARLFRASTGMTVAAYVNHRRVQRATGLLAGTSGRVAEIAFACGFESVPHFNRMFRRQTGVTPTAYRAGAKASRAAVPDAEGAGPRAT